MDATEWNTRYQSNVGYSAMESGYGGTKSKNTYSGSTLSFHNIDYAVEVKENGEKVIKNILHGVSGFFSPGMNAIMGTTGSGKSSLLDVLAARKDPRGLQGVVLIDGQAQPPDFKLMSGYVVQDDVVMGTLTVRENLAFSANLRLPRSVGARGKAERIDDVLLQLGLTLCAESQVGSEFTRGVSGGERKRTNIGMELIIKPDILFLDEPTTGLDASTAYAVLLLLSRLSQQGRCVIFSIHQPRYSIFRLFDKLHLISKGETMYHGPANMALEHFSTLGFVCEKYNNPADYFLDVLNEDVAPVKSLTDVAAESYGNDDLMEKGGFFGSKTDDLKSKLKAHFKNSVYFRDMQKTLGQLMENSRETVEPVVHHTVYPTSAFYQFLYLCQRNARNILRNPRLSSGQMFSTIIFSLLIGGIYFQLDNTATAGIQNRVGAFFFIAMCLLGANQSAVEPFITERVIFLHESASGFYRISSYFFAKIVGDLIPMRVMPTIPFGVITYFMIGYRATVDAFLIFFLTMFTTTFAACGIAFLIGASTKDVGLANLWMTSAYLFMVLFGGLLVNIASLSVWIRWMQYFSLARYCMNIFYIVEFKDRTFCDKPADNETEPLCTEGNEFLDSQGIDYSDWGIWQNQIIFLAVMFVFMALTYVKLRMLPTMK